MSNYYYTEIRINSSDRKYNKSVADLIENGVFMASFEVEEGPFVEIKKDGSCVVRFNGERCWLGKKSQEFLRLSTCEKESPIPSDLVIESLTVTNSSDWRTECFRFDSGKTVSILKEEGIAIYDFDVAFLAGDALLGEKKACESLSCKFGKLEQTDCVDDISQILGVAEILMRLEVKPSRASREGWKKVSHFLAELDWDDAGIRLTDDVQKILTWLQCEWFLAGYVLLAGNGGKMTSRGSL